MKRSRWCRKRDLTKVRSEGTERAVAWSSVRIQPRQHLLILP